MSEDIKLALEDKDRDYFLEREIPFPIYWYGYTDLPAKRKKSRAYSIEMRELSDYPIEYLEVVEMFWGMSPLVLKKIKGVPKEFVENIPVPTPTRINALIQTKLAMISSEERKEWADRVEGKAVSREVSMSLVSEDNDNSTSATRELIMSKFAEIGDVWKEYGKMATDNSLEHTETLRLETKEVVDGQAEG